MLDRHIFSSLLVIAMDPLHSLLHIHIFIPIIPLEIDNHDLVVHLHAILVLGIAVLGEVDDLHPVRRWRWRRAHDVIWILHCSWAGGWCRTGFECELPYAVRGQWCRARCWWRCEAVE